MKSTNFHVEIQQISYVTFFSLVPDRFLQLALLKEAKFVHIGDWFDIWCLLRCLMNCHTGQDKRMDELNLFIDYHTKIHCFNHLSKVHPYSSLVPC